MESEISCLEGDAIVLEFHNGRRFHKQQVDKKENLKFTQEIISEVFGSPLRIKSIMDETKNSPFKHQLKETKRPKMDVKKIMEEEPKIKEILDVLEGDIIAKDEEII